MIERKKSFVEKLFFSFTFEVLLSQNKQEYD